MVSGEVAMRKTRKERGDGVIYESLALGVGKYGGV